MDLFCCNSQNIHWDAGSIDFQVPNFPGYISGYRMQHKIKIFQLINSLINEINPRRQISAPELLAVLRRMESRGAIETVHRQLRTNLSVRNCYRTRRT
jgi:hypothetical protein